MQSCSCCCPPDSDASNLCCLTSTRFNRSRPAQLRAARRARVVGVRGKGKTQRTVFLSVDARHALADYLEEERPADTTPKSTAFFLSAASVSSRRPDGRLSGRSINTILERIGRLHDAEHTDPQRVRCDPTTYGTRSRSGSPKPPTPTPTNSNGASATAHNATSPATPTHPNMSPPVTSRVCDRAIRQ